MDDVTFRRFSDDEFPAWIAVQHRAYAEERVRAGDDRATAERIAVESYTELFPGGLPAAGHDVLHVDAAGRAVGVMWLGPHPRGNEGVWWVWDVEIDEPYRGRGYGRAAMLLAERYVAERGARELALNVFGFNERARRLYESLGFGVTAVQMSKPVQPES
ncbi:GNAT family N-acetyltransferase [Microbacterium binotii]|uniref:GNAT family N-acetyltransferase n=1 Tax=Microbacterium binotii TaxID=462710 RepID=A0ABN3PCS9_9MICO